MLSYCGNERISKEIFGNFFVQLLPGYSTPKTSAQKHTRLIQYLSPLICCPTNVFLAILLLFRCLLMFPSDLIDAKFSFKLAFCSAVIVLWKLVDSVAREVRKDLHF